MVSASVLSNDSQLNNSQHNLPLHNSQLKTANAQSQQCIIVGHSINAMTTATVMASMGNTVVLYADDAALALTLATYTFEHQLQALWQLYINEQDIVLKSLPSQASVFFSVYSQTKAKNISLFWLFYTDLPSAWHDQVDQQDDWVTQLNESNLDTQIPVVLSGITKLGTFDTAAKACNRHWVYYVPFVFLQDGQAYTSMLSPKIWLMGEKVKGSIDKVSALHPFVSQAKQSHVTDIATIEFSRSAIMNMLATRVSFMNEWSRLADYQGVDITEVATIMGLDSRIGKSYLRAGWGFGGHTLPTEISALQDTLADTQVDHRLIQAVRDINDDQKELIFRKFWQYFDGSIEGKAVAIWGASYKSGSGRTTGSAIHPLLRLLWSYNITTYVYAAEAEAELASLYAHQPLLTFVANPTEPLPLITSLFVLAWSDIKRLPIAPINEVVIPVFDAANVLSPDDIEQLTGDYIGIGRGN